MFNHPDWQEGTIQRLENQLQKIREIAIEAVEVIEQASDDFNSEYLYRNATKLRRRLNAKS